jgi:4-amino-4-deoxy-L-arabinose transferase-like glycosyltransferase
LRSTEHSLDWFARRGRTTRGFLLLLTLLACIPFLLLLGRRDIVTSHEARVAQTARQMAASGWPWQARALHTVEAGPVNPWIVPVINGQIRLQKPPLPYWFVAVLFRAFGFDEFWARFPGAVMGVIGVPVVFDLARRTVGRSAALPAALVWMSSLFIVDEFRKSMADPYLAFFTLTATWAWMRGGAIGVLTFYASLAFGSLSKGPLILLTLLPAIVACAVVARRGLRAPVRWHVVGVTLALAMTLPWPLAVWRSVPNAMDLWWSESFGKIGDDLDRARPWWSYLVNAPLLSAPWVPMWIAGLVLAAIRPGRRIFAVTWYALHILLFSFAGVKKNAYLLPAMAAQTLIIADAISLLVAWVRRRGFAGMSGVLAAAQVVVGVGFAVGIVVATVRLPERRSIDLVAVSIAAAIAVCAAACAVRSRNRRGAIAERWAVVQTAAYACAIVATVGIYLTAKDNLRSPKAFAAAVARHATETAVPLLVSRLPEEVSVYMPLEVPATGTQDRSALVVVDDARGRLARGLIADDENFFRTLLNEPRVTTARRVELRANDGRGRWRLYELTLAPVLATRLLSPVERAQPRFGHLVDPDFQNALLR